MEIKEYIMIAAIFLGPIVAIQVQKILEGWKERRSQKQKIFSTLMTTRATYLAPEHVAALNSIDLVFSKKRKKEKPVVEAWESLLDHLSHGYPNVKDYEVEDQKNLENAQQEASQKHSDLLGNLLSKMASYLGYDFSDVHIKRSVYFPGGHVEIENDNHLIRKGFIGMLYGKYPISMNITGVPDQASREAPNNNTPDSSKIIDQKKAS